MSVNAIISLERMLADDLRRGQGLPDSAKVLCSPERLIAIAERHVAEWLSVLTPFGPADVKRGSDALRLAMQRPPVEEGESA